MLVTEWVPPLLTSIVQEPASNEDYWYIFCCKQRQLERENLLLHWQICKVAALAHSVCLPMMNPWWQDRSWRFIRGEKIDTRCPSLLLKTRERDAVLATRGTLLNVLAQKRRSGWRHWLWCL